MKYHEKIKDYEKYLYSEEKSENTVKKYLHDVKTFAEHIKLHSMVEGCDADSICVLNKDAVLEYKSYLREKYTVVTVNSVIASLNSFFKFIGRYDLCVKPYKIQRKVFCDRKKELSFFEYKRLVDTAMKINNERLSLVIQTICATGIRVSELKYITVEAVEQGMAVVSLKNKTRTVILVKKLRMLLKEYLKKQKIKKGPVFVTKNGNPLDRTNIWREMKKLCEIACVDEEKVFPHNLRHLFARVFYEKEKDMAKLADILGHSNINTTRIYIISNGDEHRRKMENLRLIC